MYAKNIRNYTILERVVRQFVEYEPSQRFFLVIVCLMTLPANRIKATLEASVLLNPEISYYLVLVFLKDYDLIMTKIHCVILLAWYMLL